MDHLPEMALFARVVELKSFSAAAGAAGLSKGAVSKQVARLEAALGARLLNRTTRHLSLTDAGTEVYQHCARILAEAEAVRLGVQHLAAAPRGTLRLSASVAFGKQHVAPAMTEFLGRFPELSVQLVLTDRFVDLAEEGFDVVIRLARRLSPNVVARRLAPIRWTICGAPAYFSRHRAPRTPQDLVKHNCLFYAYESVQQGWTLLRRGAKTTVKIRGNFQVNNSEAIREATLAGLGLALIPTFAVGADISAGRLVPVLTRWRLQVPYEDAYAVYLPTRQLTPKVRAFIDFMLERFGPQPYWDGSY